MSILHLDEGMLRNLFLFVLIIKLSFSYGQEKKIVVQIDTLNLIKTNDELSWRELRLVVSNQGFANLGDEFVGHKAYGKVVPQYLNTVILKSDSSDLIIPLDRLGGKVVISNLYSLEADTLRINSYTLYSNCNFDTIRTQMVYYDCASDDWLVNQGKSYYKETVVPLECDRLIPERLDFVMNGVKYDCKVNFSTGKSGMVSSENGSKRTIFGKEKNCFWRKQIHSWGTNIVELRID